MRWFSGILLNSLLFLLLSYFLNGFEVASFGIALVASIILAIVNILIRPILILFTLPATLLTFGLFLFVINALMLLLTDKVVGSGFQIESFGTAVLIALLMTLLNTLLSATILKSSTK